MNIHIPMWFEKKSSHHAGFTIVELLVVIAIIGILASIIMANLSNSRAQSRDSKRVSDIKTIQLALSNYYNDNSSYPAHISDLVPTYLPVQPLDPNTNAAYFYTQLKATSGIGACPSPSGRLGVKYHLGAKLEVLAPSNDNVDFCSASLTCSYYNYASYPYYACDSTDADFHGQSAACGGTAGTPDKCYDVTNN